MASISCLPVPQNKSFYLVKNYFTSILNRKDVTAIVKGKDCAAAILNYFENCTNKIIEDIILKKEKNLYVPSLKEREIQVSLSYLEKTILDNNFSKNTILKSLELLVYCNFIAINKTTTSDKGKEKNAYILNIENISLEILQWIEDNPCSKVNYYHTFINEPDVVQKTTTPYCKNEPPPIAKMNIINNSLSNNTINNKEIKDINENFANFQSKILKISENDIERFLDNDVQDFLEKNKNEVIETENGKKYIVESLPLEVFEKKEKNAAQKEKAKSNLEAKTIEAKKLIQIINEKFQTKYRVEVISNLGIAVNALREYSFAEIETVIDNIYRFNALGNTAQYSSAPKDIFNLRTIEAKLNLKIQQKNQNNGSQTNRQNPSIGHNDLPRINGIVVTQELQEQAIRIAQAQRAKRSL